MRFHLVFSNEYSAFLDIMNDKRKRKLINIAIRATHQYIFEVWNRNWHSLNCLYVARFTFIHSKRQIKFPSLLLTFMITYLENYLVRWDDFQGKVRSIVFYLKTNHITSPIDLYQGGEFCKNKKKESLKLDDFFIVFSRNLKTWKFLLWSVISFFCFEAK